MTVRPSAADRRLALLRKLVAADDAASDEFMTAVADQGTTLFHNGFPNGLLECDLGDLKALYGDGFLVVTEFRPHGDMVFAVTSRAHDLVRSRD